MVFRRTIEALERIKRNQEETGNQLELILRKQDELRAGLDALGDIIAAMDGNVDPFRLDDKRMQDGISSILGYQPGKGRDR
jgi:hypothetical protein